MGSWYSTEKVENSPSEGMVMISSIDKLKLLDADTKSIYIDSNFMTNDYVLDLPSKLKALVMTSPGSITDKHIKSLPHSLTTLFIMNTGKLTPESFINLPIGLKNLKFSFPEISKAQLENLPLSLKMLELTSTNVDLSGLGKLNLRCLSIGCDNLDNDTISSLPNSLEELEIKKGKLITTLKNLNCPNLKTLKMTDNSLLCDLAGIPPTIKNLILSENTELTTVGDKLFVTLNLSKNKNIRLKDVTATNIILTGHGITDDLDHLYSNIKSLKLTSVDLSLTPEDKLNSIMTQYLDLKTISVKSPSGEIRSLKK